MTGPAGRVAQRGPISSEDPPLLARMLCLPSWIPSERMAIIASTSNSADNGYGRLVAKSMSKQPGIGLSGNLKIRSGGLVAELFTPKPSAPASLDGTSKPVATPHSPAVTSRR